MVENGTVLHEIQSLERHLDRLIPSLDMLNTRISAMEANVSNLSDMMGKLKCEKMLAQINEIRRKFDVAMAEVNNDIESINKSIALIEKDVGDIEDEDKAEKKVVVNRTWSIIEKVATAIIGGVGAYIAMKLGIG